MYVSTKRFKASLSFLLAVVEVAMRLCEGRLPDCRRGGGATFTARPNGLAARLHSCVGRDANSPSLSGRD
jgi:hypothetical protein